MGHTVIQLRLLSMPMSTPKNVVSLLQTLEGHIGVVEGTGEAFSQDCGKRFAEGLAADRAA